MQWFCWPVKDTCYQLKWFLNCLNHCVHIHNDFSYLLHTFLLFWCSNPATQLTLAWIAAAPMHPLHSHSMMTCLPISMWTLNQVQLGTQQQISHLMCNNGYQMPHHLLWPRFQPWILPVSRQGNVVICTACISFLLTWSEHVAFTTTPCPKWHPASGWQLYWRTSHLGIRCSTCSQLYPPISSCISLN